METLVLYLFKSSLITATFWSIYWCFLRNETFFRFNRYFLLAGLACALVFPFYTYSYRVDIFSSGNRFPDAPTENTEGSSWPLLGIFLYIAGVCFLLIRRLNGLMILRRVIRRSESVSVGGCNLINTEVFKSSFSVFRYIFMSVDPQTSEPEQKMIFQHELAHITQRHWIDLFAAQVLCIVQWFNPFAWLYLTAIRQNHEYLADDAVLRSGSSPALYRAALINQSLGTPAFSFASSFSQVDGLKRINMMRKPVSASARKWTVVLIPPALTLFYWVFAKPEVHLIFPGGAEISHPWAVVPPYDPPPIKDEAVPVGQQQRKPAKAEPSHAPSATASLPAATTPPKPKSMEPFVAVKTSPAAANTDRPQPLIILDGAEIKSLNGISPDDIKSVNVLKGESAISTYGDRGKNGVITISTRGSH